MLVLFMCDIPLFMASDTATAQQDQQELISEFAFFDNWMDRYQYIIDLGKTLDDFPEADRADEYKVHGCQSQVWIEPRMENDLLYFRGASDAAIVSGLIAVVLRIYSGRTPAEILQTPPDFIEKIGFANHLSPTRSNGLHSMLQKIFDYAKQYQAQISS